MFTCTACEMHAKPADVQADHRLVGLNMQILLFFSKYGLIIQYNLYSKTIKCTGRKTGNDSKVLRIL